MMILIGGFMQICTVKYEPEEPVLKSSHSSENNCSLVVILWLCFREPVFHAETNIHIRGLCTDLVRAQ